MFQINTRNMQMLRSYAACKEFFESTPQPRGQNWYAHQRPLDGNRKHHMRLDRYEDSFHCVLYSTPMVVYHEDGVIEIDCHESKTSRTFLDCTLPHGMRCIGHMGRTWVCIDNWAAYFTSDSSRLKFKLNQISNSWDLLNPEVLTTFEARKLDRKKFAEVRRNLKPYTDWRHAVDRLTSAKPSLPNSYSVFMNGAYGAIDRLLKDPTNPEHFAELRKYENNLVLVAEEALDIGGARYYVPLPPGALPARTARKAVPA